MTRNIQKHNNSTQENRSLPRDPAITIDITKASGSMRTLVKNKINVLENIKRQVQVAIKRKQPIPIFNNLMPIVRSLEVLQLAYGNIKSNAGALTPGFTKNTADGFSISRILNIQQQLKENSYIFPHVRRIWIPKPIKGVEWTMETLFTRGRPLGIPEFDARVVQEAIRLVLDAIYEPIFESINCNYGFRPKKGSHNALYNIPQKTQGMTYAIEGDIKGAFDNLDHDILIKILSKRIQDDKFLNLIFKYCRAGFFDQLQNTTKDSLLGVPQGGIASPLLWNIYMHEFDKFILNDINDTMQAINKRQNRLPSPTSKQYKTAQTRNIKHQKIYDDLTKKKQRKIINLSLEDRIKATQALKNAKTARKLMLKTPSKKASRQSIRFHYVRYADD